MRRQMGAKTREARVGLGKKWLQTALPLVAPKLIADAGAKLIARQGQKSATQIARQEASRSEAAGSLRTAKPLSTSSAGDVMATATTNLTTKLGRAPNAGEIFGEVMRLRTAA
jgi:hypothetical protein